jgi:cytochrome c oxidase subunit 2
MKIILFCFLILLSSADIFASEPKDWQLSFQPPASHLMEDLVWLHDFLMIISAGIVAVVLGLLIYVCTRFSSKRNPVPAKFSHNIAVEIVWTIIPLIILAVMAVPSFKILKTAQHSPEHELTIKVVGYQWYWHYIYPDNDKIEFDSYMISDSALKPGQKRLLEVDNRLVVPENTVIKFLITAGDVIHSFAIPALGLKMDAIPGRLNETWTKVLKKGVYYGQCSELCGVNHGFMPIAIEVVSKEEFKAWLASAKQKFSSNGKMRFVNAN